MRTDGLRTRRELTLRRGASSVAALGGQRRSVGGALDRIASGYSLKANVISLRTADKMVGTVLNLKAQPALASAWTPLASGKLP